MWGNSLHADFKFVVFRLNYQDLGLATNATDQYGIITSPMHLVPPHMCSGIRVCPTLGFRFYRTFMKWINVRYLHRTSERFQS